MIDALQCQDTSLRISGYHWRIYIKKSNALIMSMYQKISLVKVSVQFIFTIKVGQKLDSHLLWSTLQTDD